MLRKMKDSEFEQYADFAYGLALELPHFGFPDKIMERIGFRYITTARYFEGWAKSEKQGKGAWVSYASFMAL